MIVCLLYDMLHTLITGKQAEIPVADFRIADNRKIGDSEIMERTQQVFFHRLLQSDLMSDVIVEQFVNVPAFNVVIPFIRCCSHTEP